MELASILAGLFYGSSAILIFYYLFFFLKLARCKVSDELPDVEKLAPVSVLISARNEAENLKNNLPFVLEQDYPLFEVIVINDRSTDETRAILEQFKSNYDHLKIVEVKETENKIYGKKSALSEGIKLSENEVLVFTDADCKPASEKWIQYLISGFTHPKTEIITGYSPYTKINGSLLNQIIQFETALTAMQYLSAALKGKPYMGVGRNLAYRKSVFNKVGGYSSHTGILSGDDDLFVNEAANKTNTKIEIHPKSFVYSYPKEKWKDYIRQKKRHLTTGTRYKANHKLILGMFLAANYLFFISLAGVLITSGATLLLLVVLALKYGVQYKVYTQCFKKLRVNILNPALIIFEVIYYSLYLYICGSFLLNKKVTWT